MAAVGIKRTLLDHSISDEWVGIDSDDSDVKDQYGEIEGRYMKREQQLYSTHEVPVQQQTQTPSFVMFEQVASLIGAGAQLVGLRLRHQSLRVSRIPTRGRLSTTC